MKWGSTSCMGAGSVGRARAWRAGAGDSASREADQRADVLDFQGTQSPVVRTASDTLTLPGFGPAVAPCTRLPGTLVPHSQGPAQQRGHMTHNFSDSLLSRQFSKKTLRNDVSSHSLSCEALSELFTGV